MAEPWYTFPRIDNYGSPDPFGGFPKPDSNIQVPDNYPITALLGGTVSGINAPDGSVPDWGAVITIQLDQPLNSLASHTAYLHLSSIAPGLTVGTKIAAGDLVGYSGGGSAAGAQKVPVGFALYGGDYYGFGPEWGANLGNPLLDMTSLLNQAANGSMNIPSSGALPVTGAAGGIIGLSAIIGWLGSMETYWNWLRNPLRIIKVVVGIGLILGSVFLLLRSE